VPDARRFTATIDIAASPERVWAVMSDVERWPEWTASMTRVERFDASPLGVGSRVRVKQPRLAAALFEITKWEPGRGFDWIAPTAAVTADARHLIEPVVDGARVTLSVEFSGPLATPVAWWFGGLTKRYIAMEAEGLKRRAEGLPGKPSDAAR
jgi:uncharacterized protein YndB with AHSA1/START domain